MNSVLFDASALTKRFVLESGTPLVNAIFAKSPAPPMLCLMLGLAEVVAALVRKRNAGSLSRTLYSAAMVQVRDEVLDSPSFAKLAVDNVLIERALVYLHAYAINASDAILLVTALDRARVLRVFHNDVVVVSSDKRFLTAARNEGLLVFDPEMQTQADLDALLGT